MNYLLRDWTIEDKKDLLKYLNNPNISNLLTDGVPYPFTDEDAHEYIQFCISSNKIRTFVQAIEINGEAVGSIGLFVKHDIYRKSAELGCWLAEPYWNQNIMTEALKEMLVKAFASLDIRSVFAKTLKVNKAGERMLEKAGFTFEGVLRKNAIKNGQIMDCKLYSILREEILSQ